MMEYDRDNRPRPAAPCCDSRGRDTRPAVDENAAPGAEGAAETVLPVSGMRCGACAARIHDALMKLEGVLNAQVSLKDATAWVRFDAGRIRRDELRTAVAAAGYATGDVDGATTGRRATPFRPGPNMRLVWAAAAAVGVVGFYLGLITLTSNWSNAVYQFGEYGGWVIALALGLGVQVGLFVHMRAALAGARLKGAASGMAASGGMSGVAMALCCSHYLAAVLPAIGLPFFSGAVAGLVEYQTAFFIVGVVSNLLGIAYMVRLMQRNGVITRGRAYA